MTDKGTYSHVDDGLEGVDDFLDEVNPFEADNDTNLNQQSSPFDEIPSDTVNLGSKNSNITQLPPAYDDTIHVDQETNAGVAPVRANKELPPGLLNYLSQFFDLTTEDFRRRVFTFLKFNGSIFENDVRELYGTIWVTFSAILVNFMSPSFMNIIYENIIVGNRTSALNYREDIYFKLIMSIWFFPLYTVAIPFVISKFIQKEENARINPKVNNFVNLISVYGYSNIIWIIVMPILHLLDKFSYLRGITLVKLIVLLIGWLKTSLFMYYQVVVATENSNKPPVSFISMILMQFIFSILVFFIFG